MVIILRVLSCGPLNLHNIIIIARQVVSPLPIAARLRNRHCYARHRRRPIACFRVRFYQRWKIYDDDLFSAVYL